MRGDLNYNYLPIKLLASAIIQWHHKFESLKTLNEAPSSTHLKPPRIKSFKRNISNLKSHKIHSLFAICSLLDLDFWKKNTKAHMLEHSTRTSAGCLNMFRVQDTEKCKIGKIAILNKLRKALWSCRFYHKQFIFGSVSSQSLDSLRAIVANESSIPEGFAGNKNISPVNFPAA